MTARSLLAAPLLALALSACGSTTYDRAKLEQNIKTKLGQHRGFQVQSAHCPSNAKLAKGVVINCSATLVGGHVVAVRNIQLDNKGSVRIVINEELPDNVERGIRVTLAQRGTSATASCPLRIPIVIGKQFSCAVTYGSGRHGRAIVTIVDQDGGFRLAFP